MILTVEPAGYADAVAGLQAGNRLAASLHGELVAGWSGLGGMAGDDATATDFAAAYDEAATEAGDALVDVVAAFTTLGRLTEQSLRNHEHAEERSILVGAVVSGPDAGAPLSTHRSVLRARPPTSLGGDAPGFTPQESWVLDHIEGFVWPDADVDRVREAARLWRRTAGTLDVLAEQCGRVTVALDTQRSPEIPLATAAVADLGGTIGDLATSCEALAAHCDTYADAVEQQRAAILSLVREILLFVVEGMVVGAVIGAVTAGAGTAAVSGAVVARVASQSPRFTSLLTTLRGTTAAIATSVRVTRDALRLRRTRLERFLGVPVRTEAGQLSLGSTHFRPGWLARHERAGSHTLSRHVGKTEDELRRRLADSPGLRRASTFRDLATAERGVARALVESEQRVTEWLASSADALVITTRIPQAGMGVSAEGSVQTLHSVRVVLVQDAAMPQGYRVLTAYPTP